MRSLFARALAWVCCFTLCSCAHSVHQVNVTSFDLSKAERQPQVVEALAEQDTIMGFVYNTDYIDQAYEELQRKCTGGSIEGVLTQFSTSLGFFSWTNKIAIKGFCIK